MQTADVKSVEALQDLHTAVTGFRTDAQEAIEAVNLSVRKGHDYLSDQLKFWQAAIRTTEDEVFQAKQELAQRKYVGFDGRVPDTTVQEQNLRRAQAKLKYAHDKVDKVRMWQRRLGQAVNETWDGPGRQHDHRGRHAAHHNPEALHAPPRAAEVSSIQALSHPGFAPA